MDTSIGPGERPSKRARESASERHSRRGLTVQRPVFVEIPVPTPKANQQDNCARAKLRCLGKEEPPCERCSTGGLRCTFDRSARVLTADVSVRLDDMGEQINRLERLVMRLVEQSLPRDNNPHSAYTMFDLFD